MNELLLQQILQNQPRVNHLTEIHVRKIEPLYLACLYIDPSIADIEIDDNSTTDDVFRLLNDLLKENEVTIEYERGNKGTNIEFTYQISSDFKIIELYKLLQLKKTSALKYDTLLNCVALLSHHCENFLEYHEIIKEGIDEEILNNEIDQSEHTQYDECKKLIECYREIENDYFGKRRLGSENIIHELKRIHTSSILLEKYDEKTARLVKIIVDNFKDWELFYKAESYSDNQYYDNDYMNFAALNCFAMTLENEYYTDWLNSHYQFHWENEYVNDKFIYMNRDIENVYKLKSAHATFINALALADDIIKEVK